MKLARYVAEGLRDRGVKRIFGLPGTETIELNEAARAAGIDFFLTHHEGTATFAAGMVGQLTGIPGVCLVTAGPGATNTVSGVSTAYLDRRPLLAIIADHDQGPGQPAHQRIPLDLFAGVSRARARTSASTVARDLDRLFGATTSGVHGPSVLVVPTPEALKEVTDTHGPGETAVSTAVPDLAPVLAALAKAERPMIIAGLGVANARAGAELRALAEAFGCPVADTPQLKGWFPSSHPLYAGLYATHRNAQVLDLASRSDLILAVGLDSTEFLRPWQIKTRVVSVRGEGEDDPGVPADVVVRGPLAAMLACLTSDARVAGAWPAGTAGECRRASRGGRAREGRAPAGTLWPQSVATELRRALPEDGIVTVDVGSHKLLMTLQWESERPNSFLNSSGMASMGTGLPFAMAAKLTFPERPVAAMIGDGGCLMYAGELATLARSGLPIVVVIMADAALYSIKIKQVRRSYPATGTEFAPPAAGFAQLARDFGLAAERVSSVESCARAMKDALRRDAPSVIEVVIDPAGYDRSQ